jgi:hypothetical protein
MSTRQPSIEEKYATALALIDVWTDTCGQLTQERHELLENLTATQKRCTELLDEARAKGREIERLKETIDRLLYSSK